MNPVVAFVREIIFSGLEALGRYYSSYRGIVIDNKDPENLNRLQLAIPQINGAHLHDYWAHPKGLFSGKNYGVQMLPQIGDMVWVEFEGGNAEVPMWSHGHKSKKEVPEDKEFRDVNTYWFKSPKGHLVIINDTKNTIEIKAADKGTINIISNKRINLGSTEPVNPVVLGNELKSILSRFINTVSNVKIVTGVVSPDDKIKLSLISSDLDKILSKIVRVE